MKKTIFALLFAVCTIFTVSSTKASTVSINSSDPPTLIVLSEINTNYIYAEVAMLPIHYVTAANVEYASASLIDAGKSLFYTSITGLPDIPISGSSFISYTISNFDDGRVERACNTCKSPIIGHTKHRYRCSNYDTKIPWSYTLKLYKDLPGRTSC